jgi:hypothetical protein
MPIRPAVAGVVKVEALFTNSVTGQIAVATYWTHKAATVDMDRINADVLIVAQIYHPAGGNVAARIASAWTLTLTKAWDFSTSPPTKMAQNVWSIAGAGSGGLPSTVSIPIALRTQPVGAPIRGVNGRLAHIGPSSGDVSGDTVTSGAALITGYGYGLAHFGTDAHSGTWVVISFFKGGTRRSKVPRTPPLVLPVNHILVPTLIGVQRRRRARQNSYALGS